MDRRAIIGHIAAKYNIKMDETDPAFLLVEINQIALEAASRDLESKLIEAREQLTGSIGAMAGAIEEMNAAADRLVEAKMVNLNQSINQLVGITIKNTIEQSLNAAVAKEIQAIRREVGIIAGSLQDMHTQSGRSQILAGAGAGALAAILTLGAAWWAVSSGKLPIDVRVDSASVAQTVLNGVKALPKTR